MQPNVPKEQIEQRAQQRNDPRYVDVKGSPTGERRYLIAQDRPELLAAWQSTKLPDHIRIAHINTEGFTATDDQAAEVWAHLERANSDRQQQTPQTPAAAANTVLARELHQQELGNVPQAAGQQQTTVVRAYPEKPEADAR